MRPPAAARRQTLTITGPLHGGNVAWPRWSVPPDDLHARHAGHFAGANSSAGGVVGIRDINPFVMNGAVIFEWLEDFMRFNVRGAHSVRPGTSASAWSRKVETSPTAKPSATVLRIPRRHSEAKLAQSSNSEPASRTGGFRSSAIYFQSARCSLHGKVSSSERAKFDVCCGIAKVSRNVWKGKGRR
jgi:hypothetical protein